jgi:Zn-dependent M28 family amino/carboxypeptidase
MIVASASVPQPAGTPMGQRVAAHSPQAPEIIPQVVFAAEHYNRLVRLVQQGHQVRLAMELEVTFTKPDSGFNIIAEIPGTDLKDEIVMLGGHFDTWHAGTGATDNNTGTAACMEAARILQKLVTNHGLKLRRTVRIGLWGGEEQGLYGSREYVTQYLASRAGNPLASGADGGGGVQRTPGFDKFSVYFNHDNGTGRIRGIYLQGNETARPVFRRWLTAFGDPTAQTVTAMNTGGTDHQSFDAVGLPAFQFIQDPVEYDTRTHHSNMDVLERVQAEDMKQAATLMAFFAYSAANREERIPRKPAPGPAGR